MINRDLWISFLSTVWLVLLSAGATSMAQETGEREVNFDRRLRTARFQTASPQAGQLNALSQLRNELDGSLLASFDESSGVTRTLFNPVGKLTSAQDGDPQDLALSFLGSNLDLLGLEEGDIDEIEVCDLVTSRVSDATHIYLCQSHRSLPIFNAQLHINVSGDGSILSVNNSFVPGLRRVAKAREAGIGAPDAVLAVAKQLRLSGAPRPRAGRGGEKARRVSMISRDISGERIDAELSWLPSGRELNLVWRFLVHTPDRQHVYDFTVDAGMGPPSTDESRIWTRYDLVSSDEYRVYPLPVESPLHTTPTPPADARVPVANPADTGASMLGWHSTGTSNFTIMRGNNVHAYEDGDNNDQPPAVEPSCGASLSCDFPLDLNQHPSSYTNASVANLFYWNNIIHDIQYQYGFDEAAGNFQVNNFGRGGQGGDDVRAEAQDGSGINNANFLTLPDGGRPRMQMYLWDLSSPMRDASLDAGVIVHEYGHGISTRLVGGPSTVSCLQNQQQPGEGLSDWWTLVYTAKVGDRGEDPRGIGNYVYSQNGDVGIRTQPYSTDPTVNTHSYESIDGMVVPHGVGEVWAQVAWEAYWALVQVHGFDPDLYNAMGGSANQRMMLYVNEGLKNTACSPAFTDVRDGVIQAAVDNYGGEDVCTLWKAFADFGLGVNAVSGGPNSTSPINGFDLPIQCIGGTLQGTVESTSGALIPGASIKAGGFTAVTGADGTYSLDLPQGTYDVTASAFGFEPSSVSGIVITIDSTVVADYVLTARPATSLSGTVTDGSDAGWPLYARVDITALTPQTTQTVFTHPGTGHYGSVSLVQDESYQIVVTSVLPGYFSSSRTVTALAGGLTEDFALAVNFDACAAPGYGRDTPMLVWEGFEGSFPPPGWTVSHSTTGCSPLGLPAWNNTNPGGRSNFTGGSGLFAIADSDVCGSAVSMDTMFESPMFDLSGLGAGDSLRIEFKHLFTQFSGIETANVDLWDGTSWLNLEAFGGGGYASGTVVIHDSAAIGVPDAKLRFHYASYYDFWWEIDDVRLSVGPDAPQCSFRGGGLVWGTVAGQASGAPINGATVEVIGASSTQTSATPDDPILEDGFYLLHAQSGPQALVATAPGFGADSADITVTTGNTTELDFLLPTAPTLRLSTASYTVSEGTAAAAITVSRGGSDVGEISVNYATTDGSAVQGADYAATSGTLTFTNGDMADKTFVVPILEDTIIEGDEIVLLTLSNPTGGAVLGTPDSAGLIIVDNENVIKTVWVEDAPPAGGTQYGTWDWVSSNPNPYSGSVAHQSVLTSGLHQHYFVNAIETLSVDPGDTLFSYVFLDPANPPTEIMLQWSDGSFDHRTYWGANQIPLGTDGTESRRYMGPLPPTGQWVRLNVLAGDVGLEGKVAHGMAFTLYGGRATWDYAGKFAFPPAPSIQLEAATYRIAEDGGQATITVTRTGGESGAVSVDYSTSDGTATGGADYAVTSGTISFADGDMADKTFVIPIHEDTRAEGVETVLLILSNPTGGAELGDPNTADLSILDNEVFSESIWVEDTLPSGARAIGTWSWVSSNPDPFSGSLAHQFALAAGLHQHYFDNATATLSVGAGDTLFTYVYLDPDNPPSEIMLQWRVEDFGHRAYWGEDLIALGIDGTESRRFMGPLPPTGQWVRLEVPAVEVGLVGQELNGLAFTLYDGRATWDYAGKSSAPPAPTIQFSSATFLTNENAGQATIAVERWGGANGTVSVDYTTGDGSATAGGDYTPASGTLTFADGDTTDKSFLVPVLVDGLIEGDETVLLSLSNATGGAVLGSPVDAVLTIADDDVPPETVWVEDSVPAGASSYGTWNWVDSSPDPFSGSLAHQSTLTGGLHQHYFTGATDTLTVGADDTLFTYVYLDPNNPPSEIMLQWRVQDFGHRAYWGENLITFGTDGTESRRFMGPLPPTGQWIRLDVLASEVGLQEKTLKGMAFTLYDGRATWDFAGKSTEPPPASLQFTGSTYRIAEDGIEAAITVRRTRSGVGDVSVDYTTSDGTAAAGIDYSLTSGTIDFADGEMGEKTFMVPVLEDSLAEGVETIHLTLSHPTGGAVLGAPNTAVLSILDNDLVETVWLEDSAPAGAWLRGSWSWIGSNPDPYSGTLAHQSTLYSGKHQHYFYNATERLLVEPGDRLFTYVYLDPANPPVEVMLQWNDGSWSHRAYWGENLIAAGTDGTESRRFMGPLPPTGQWIRLEVPSALVGLEGRTLNGMAFTLYGGRAIWDHSGKAE